MRQESHRVFDLLRTRWTGPLNASPGARMVAAALVAATAHRDSQSRIKRTLAGQFSRQQALIKELREGALQFASDDSLLAACRSAESGRAKPGTVRGSRGVAVVPPARTVNTEPRVSGESDAVASGGSTAWRSE